MSNADIISKINELQELKRMSEELSAMIESISDEIKQHMTSTNTDTLVAGGYKVSFKSIASSRFDSSAFKKAMPDVAAQFTKQTVTRRLTIN